MPPKTVKTDKTVIKCPIAMLGELPTGTMFDAAIKNATKAAELGKTQGNYVLVADAVGQAKRILVSFMAAHNIAKADEKLAKAV